jgi:Sec-independent protein translocase protein TatA
VKTGKMAQFHAGFMTYLLVVVIGLVVVGLVDPTLFREITNLIGQLARAAQGG